MATRSAHAGEAYDEVLPAVSKAAMRLCLAGGRRLVREGLKRLLESQGLRSVDTLADEAALQRRLACEGDAGVDVIVLLLCHEPFAAGHRIAHLLSAAPRCPALVVVGEATSRCLVYAALRAGAKAYVSLDGGPQELLRAIRTAAENKAYLSPAAADLLVADISEATDSQAGPRLMAVDLSRREEQIVQLLCDGLTSKEAGRRLHISAKTVENHRHNVYRKWGVDGLAGLMRCAVRQGLISL